MDADTANLRAREALVALLAAAHPFTFVIEGETINVAVAEASVPDGQGSASPAVLDVTWPDGNIRLWLRMSNYRRKGETLTRWGVTFSSRGRADVLWVDLTNLLTKLEVGQVAPVIAYMILSRLGAAKNAADKRLASLISGSGMVKAGKGSVKAGELSADGTLRPSAASVFEALAKATIVKIPFYALREDSRHVGAPPYALDIAAPPGPPVADGDAEGDDEEPSEDILNRIYEALEAKGQVILSGPPGTGKTRLARDFERYQRRQEGGARADPITPHVKGRAVWEAVALALWVHQGEPASATGLSVPKIVELPIVRAFMDSRTDMRMTRTESVRQALRFHSVPEAPGVGSTRRFDPPLFTRSPDGNWRIAIDGESGWPEFAEDNRSVHDRLRAPTAGADAANDAMLVTFHQAFAYEDFVEGLRPVVDSGFRNLMERENQYEVRDGAFMMACRRAMAQPSRKHLLIIDEINRGNIAGILGELITLLEMSKRARPRERADQPPLFASEGFVDDDVAEKWTRGPDTLVATLPYSQFEFTVPDNLWIIGTMNTADRSIALLDIALRRRFAFVDVAPDPDVVEEQGDGAWAAEVANVLRRLNERIRWVLDPGHEIGHSYFIPSAAAPTEDEFLLRFHRAWSGDVLPLLSEYFHGRPERMATVIGDGWFERIAPPAGVMDEDDIGHRLVLQDPWTMEPKEVWHRVRKGVGMADST